MVLLHPQGKREATQYTAALTLTLTLTLMEHGVGPTNTNFMENLVGKFYITESGTGGLPIFSSLQIVVHFILI